MYAKVISSSLWGISSQLVVVELDARSGLPAFNIVGLPDTAVKESRDRVVAALKNAELDMPVKKITVNLAPAHLKKAGPAFDLPIALALLVASGEIRQQSLSSILVFGELSLDGRVCPVQGVLPMVMAAKHLGFTTIMVPKANASEAAVVEDCRIIAVAHLREAVDHLNNKITLPPVEAQPFSANNQQPLFDFADVRGQLHAKRALEVAASGGHNVLMIGPPGSGKSMLANCLPGILPPLTHSETIEASAIYSISGLLPRAVPLLTERPFRSPHHSISPVALIGGGTYPKPGEVSLAHHGVLFLDELPEFSKHALEVLRQPLENGHVAISRTAAAVDYPCRFMLIAAMNPCPCGYFGDPKKHCTCMPHQINNYLGKVSGPLLDRFDIHIEVPAVNYHELTATEQGESSLDIRKRLVSTRRRQYERYEQQPSILTNAHLDAATVKTYCMLTDEGKKLIKMTIDRLGLSARGYHRLLKVARTIADMEKSRSIESHHLSEAIQYRALDKRYWQYQSGMIG